MTSVQAHIIIIGRVQRVGFRYFVKSHAQRLGLTGWVRNLPDGSVEATLQGDKLVIEQMIDLCRKGPFLAEVSDVALSWEETHEHYTEFTIQK